MSPLETVRHYPLPTEFYGQPKNVYFDTVLDKQNIPVLLPGKDAYVSIACCFDTEPSESFFFANTAHHEDLLHALVNTFHVHADRIAFGQIHFQNGFIHDVRWREALNKFPVITQSQALEVFGKRIDPRLFPAYTPVPVIFLSVTNDTTTYNLLRGVVKTMVPRG